MGFLYLDVATYLWPTVALMEGQSTYPTTPTRWSKSVVRPPWATELRIKQSCTSCDRCVQACPENILMRGPGNTPIVDFSKGECTFCEACAEACPEPVFVEVDQPAWNLTAHLSTACLLTRGISCQICTDFCDTDALTFDLSVRPVGQIIVDAAACTGCGACVASCPQAAITVTAHV